MIKNLRSVQAILLTAAALGLASPAKAGEFSLSVKDGSTEVFYHLGQNPSMEEFQNAKIQLQKLMRKETNRRPSTTALPTQWGGQTGAPISFPDAE